MTKTRPITAPLNRERLKTGLARHSHERIYRLIFQNGLLLQRYTRKPLGRSRVSGLLPAAGWKNQKCRFAELPDDPPLVGRETEHLLELFWRFRELGRRLSILGPLVCHEQKIGALGQRMACKSVACGRNIGARVRSGTDQSCDTLSCWEGHSRSPFGGGTPRRFAPLWRWQSLARFF
jgi:hypothetical protein